LNNIKIKIPKKIICNTLKISKEHKPLQAINAGYGALKNPLKPSCPSTVFHPIFVQWVNAANPHQAT